MNKEIIYNNHSISYRVIGSGKPVILIHGFGEDGTVWENQAPSDSPKGGENASAQNLIINNSLLNKGYQFIIPDLPGSGKSEMIDDMSIEGMAEVVKEIMITEFSEVPPSGGFGGAVIGHSMGGYITLALVEKYYNHVSSFGLFHSTAFADSEEKKVTRRKGIEFINEHGAFEFLKTATPNLYAPDTKLHNAQLVESQINSLSYFTSEALIAYYNAMIQRPDRTSVLKTSKIPILFIMGEYDNAIPLQDVLKQCHFAENSYIHILRNSGHMGMQEETEKTNKILSDFLSAVHYNS
jgi:pimeloyl-ACP methyl ester carboxylesterase